MHRQYIIFPLMLMLASCDENSSTRSSSASTETQVVRGIAGSEEQTVSMIAQSNPEVISEVADQIAAAGFSCDSVTDVWKIIFENTNGVAFLKARCSNHSYYQVTLFQGRGFVKPWTGTLLGG